MARTHSTWSTASVSPRASRLPDNWYALRTAVLRDANYRCQARDSLGNLCGERANQADHIVPGDDHSKANLRALCAWHHKQKSASEGGNAAAARRPSRHRPPEAHPGMVAGREHKWQLHPALTRGNAGSNPARPTRADDDSFAPEPLRCNTWTSSTLATNSTGRVPDC